jgi:hypothetical protein
MFVKISGEQVIPNYTVKDFRLNPNVSFSLNITDDILVSRMNHLLERINKV